MNASPDLPVRSLAAAAAVVLLWSSCFWGGAFLAYTAVHDYYLSSQSSASP